MRYVSISDFDETSIFAGDSVHPTCICCPLTNAILAMNSAAFSRAFCILTATAFSTSAASLSFSAMIPARRSSSAFVLFSASCALLKSSVADFNSARSESSFPRASISRLSFSVSQSLRISAFAFS